MTPSSQQPLSSAGRQQSDQGGLQSVARPNTTRAEPVDDRPTAETLPANGTTEAVAGTMLAPVNFRQGRGHLDGEAQGFQGDALADLPSCFAESHRSALHAFQMMLKLPRNRFTFHQKPLEVSYSESPAFQAVPPSAERLEQYSKVVDLLMSGDKDSVAAILSSSAETEQSLLDPSGPMVMLAIDQRLPTIVMAILELTPSHCFAMTDANGQNALHALAGGRVDLVQAVLDAVPGEALAQRSTFGVLPLHCFFSSLSGHATHARDCVFELLERSSPEQLTETDQNGRNLLHFVASSRLTLEDTQHIIRLLPESALSQTDCNGRTPLHTAAFEGSHEMSIRFTDSTPSAVLYVADNQGFCPLELALARCGLHDFQWSHYNGMRLERLIVRTLEDIEAVANFAWKTSPLHLMWNLTPAVLLETASRLLMGSPMAREWALRPDPASGDLLIQVAASRAVESESLLRLIALYPTEQLVAAVASTGETVLHLAAGRGLADVVHALLERLPPSAISHRDHNGGTPLLSAAQASSDEVVTVLCDAYRGSCPFTAEEWARLHAGLSADTCLALVQKYSPTYLESTAPEEWEGGQTPLHTVCCLPRNRTAQDPAPFRQLVQLCPPWFVTVLNWRGRNPIHEALASNDNLLLKILLESEEGHLAATMPMGGDGYRPLEIAVRQSNVEAVQLLIGCLSVEELLLPTKDGGTLVQFLDHMAAIHKKSMLGMVYKMRSLLRPSPKSAIDS